MAAISWRLTILELGAGCGGRCAALPYHRTHAVLLLLRRSHHAARLYAIRQLHPDEEAALARCRHLPSALLPMRLQRRAHRRQTLRIYGKQPLNVAPLVAGLNHLAHHLLHERRDPATGEDVRVAAQLIHDGWSGLDPANPQPRPEDLGEG